MLALWALVFLSAVVLGWAKLVDRQIASAHGSNLALEAYALAHSGAAMALSPAITRESPELNGSLGSGHTYSVTITGEGGKLNLNYLLAGEASVRLAILREYLTRRGLTFQERETFIDCLLDWVDADGLRRLNGAEEGPNYKPANRPLTSLDEIPLIKGSGPLTAHAGWKDDLTLVSSGPLDLESAPARLLDLIPGISPAQADRFVQYRQGRDGRDGTADDHVFRDIGEAIGYLGFSGPQFNQIGSLISFRDPVVRIQSTGQAGEAVRQVEIVARKVPGANPFIFSWTEK